MAERVFICLRLKPRATEPEEAKKEFAENLRRAKVIARYAVLRGYDPEATTIYYTQLLNDFSKVERKIGVNLGRERIAACQRMWVIDREDGMSEGMQGDEAKAKELGLVIEDKSFKEIVSWLDEYDRPTIDRALLYTMRNYAVRSRDNSTDGRPRDIYEGDKAMDALAEFARSPERCLLVLEMRDGREISIYPRLKAEATAFREAKKEGVAEPEYAWEVVVDIWPR